ncbi:WD40/YVTN repeat-like-containing domain-containing protein [Artemisia annua]|nr:WD40/YVTN repeat-like-containing domain-containing protein [Artemisia annua]
MALLTPPASPMPDTSSMPLPMPLQVQNAGVMSAASVGPLRMASSKMPKGRHLAGSNLVYDIDVRMSGEVQPQLEVTPITKYGSDASLVVGRRIAVSKSYICYGLKPGTIRVLNYHTALRALFKGLAERVTDMAFFAEDVHLLASASMDGRVYVWKIAEGPDEDDKPEITGNIVIAVQFVGDGEPVRPRVCWHCHKQEVLVVGIGNRILRIDTTKVGRGKVYSAEEPLMCPVDKLIDGIQFVGKHDGEVTDLSMCQWMTTRLASASVDGTIKIWEDRKQSPIAVLRPHDGLPVNSVTFLTAPHRPDHIILITGGPLNREVKIWASDSEEGWLLPSDADSWHCTQALELKSSAEPRIEDAFFNQVIALPQSGLLLLANARKNAIYAVHLDYGPNPETTLMDYIAEFTVTMPILSFTGISDPLPNGDHIVKVYCVQTQAIQQYALDLSQCLPPPIYDIYDKSGSPVSRDETSAEGFMGLGPSNVKLEPSSSDVAPISIQRLTSPSAEAESKPVSSLVAKDTDISSVVSPAVPLSPKLSEKIYDLRSPSSGSDSLHQLNSYDDQKIVEYPANTRLESSHSNLSHAPSLDHEENKVAKEDRSVKFMHPTHLVTPAELMATSSCEVNEVAVNSDTQNAEVEVKVVGETGISQNGDAAYEVKEQSKSFSSQASALGRDMARDMVNESNQFDGCVESKVVDQTSDARGELGDVVTDLSAPVEMAVTGILQSEGSKLREKKKKKKNALVSGQSGSPSVSNNTDSCDEVGVSSSISSAEAILLQIQSMQESLAQVLLNQKEIEKQIPMAAAAPMTKEGKRIEAAIGKSMEKIHKAHNDANWARSQEEFAKQEKLNQERHQQVSTSASVAHKDLLVATEKMLKKEIAAVGPSVGRAVTPIIEKALSTAVTEAFQRGVGDKAVNQLEKTVNSKLEATVSRQIQAQFQTSGKQALQEALRLSMEASVVPAFEMSCKTMFEQVDATFQKGMVEHTNAAQQKVESTHSPLVFALRDAINSASSMTHTLTSELADGQRKLMALAVSGASSNPVNPLISQLSNGPTGGFHEKVEAPVDPTKELSRMLTEHKYEEAFTAALQRSDLRIVSWLCSQVDLQGILASNPLPLSQGVLLSLLQQLACDIGNDTTRKLSWMMDVVVAIKPSDGIIAMHVRPIFEQVYSILNNQVNVPTNSVSELSSLRVVIKLINSTLMSL